PVWIANDVSKGLAPSPAFATPLVNPAAGRTPGPGPASTAKLPLVTRFVPVGVRPAGHPTLPAVISSAPMSQTPPRLSPSMSVTKEQLRLTPAFWAVLPVWMCRFSEPAAVATNATLGRDCPGRPPPAGLAALAVASLLWLLLLGPLSPPTL